jgi:hypothetical protein
MKGSLRKTGNTVFIDRNTGGKAFKNIVLAAGIKIVLHDDHFPHPKPGEKNIPDQEWLVTIGRLGWFVVTGDKRTLKELPFLQKIPESNAFVFVLDDMNGGSPERKAEVVISAYPKMIGLAMATKRPAVWLVQNSTFRLYDWRGKLRQIQERDRPRK